MIESLNDRDPVERLADEFSWRCRRGESPSVSEYAASYPEYAARIESLFPAVAMMEQFRADEKVQRESAIRRTASFIPPDQIGDFEIIQEIGRGGMGIVYEAEQRSLRRRVAVKVLPKHLLLLENRLKRFQREAQTAARLHHTNIVPVLGVGDQDGLYYYVMPLVRGVGLDEIIRDLHSRGGVAVDDSAPCSKLDHSARDIKKIVQVLTAQKFPTTRSNGTSGKNGKHPEIDLPSGRARRSLCTDSWRMVARIGVQAAQALDYAHAHGTLHRDIKPANLLVDEEGVVRIADFGLARAVDQTDVSRSGEIVGTLRYMAPEQLRGTSDARSDIYALGLSLYELLTLRPAFKDTDRRRCLNGQPIGLEPKPPRKINQKIPRDLETIILKCLAYESSKRYPSAAAVAVDLQRFLENRPILARRASPIERLWRWSRRNPALAATSGLAALLLIAVMATALAGFLQTRRAYAGTKVALTRAEATSRLALGALDNIYLQLSPDRVWIASDSDPGGDACACIGLRSGSASSAGGTLVHVQASQETASLLQNLLVFYDRLAEQAGDDYAVALNSAVASRRVGDIRQRLGQADEAEREYLRALGKLTALDARSDADGTIQIERAHCQNEIGNVRSARLEFERAYESHRKAFSILQSVQQTGTRSQQYRYELARTLYFLASKHLSSMARPRRMGLGYNAARLKQHNQKNAEYRRLAIHLLEELTRENPNTPDYRFLLALCHRPSDSDLAPAEDLANSEGRQQAIRILEELKSQYPGVADYRYELAVTYAWIRVSLFPWQKRSVAPAEAEESLRKALDESQWLITQNPTIPHYASSQTLILAKLGTVFWNTGRLAEAEGFFQKALQRQTAVITEFPDLPSHNRVLLEFVRLRLAQLHYERNIRSHNRSTLSESREVFQTCLANLTELTRRPELAEDRLAWSSLPVARKTLSRVLEEENGIARIIH